MRPFVLATLALGVSFLTAVPSHAAVITYTAAGVYADSIPASQFTVPGQSWKIQFTVAENPALVFPAGGASFYPQVSDFHYFLNNQALDETLTALYFYSAGTGGAFSLGFAPTVNPDHDSIIIYFAGPQMYSGGPATPTMLTGTFPLYDSEDTMLYLNGRYSGQGPSGVVVGSVPEPTSCGFATVPVLLCLSRRIRARGTHTVVRG